MAKTASFQHDIVAFGNYPMAPGGQDLYSCPGCSKGNPKLFFNGSPGQLVAYTINGTGNVPTTVGVADIPTTTGDLYIGRFVDLDGDGAADDVQLIAGESLTKCDIDEAGVASPTCGLPAIKALSLDCVDCNETYTIKATIEDNLTRTWSPIYKGGAEFIATYTTECANCKDCGEEQNCSEVICGLVDSLNGELTLMVDENTPYPDRKKNRLERPYKAFRGHANWFTYCLNPDPAECEGCTSINALLGATINDVAVTFEGNLDPADNTKTLIPQVQNIAQQLNCHFDEQIGTHSGTAFVTAGVTSCCPLQLHVNTCDANFVLTEDDGAEGTQPVATCDNDYLPLEFTTGGCCTEVDPDTGACIIPQEVINNPDCWLGIIADPAKPPCDSCYLERPWNWYGIKVDLEIVKDPNDFAPTWRQYNILEPMAPRNFGSQIGWLEYKNSFPRGRGRNHNVSNPRRGWLGLPDKSSRINTVTSKCDSLYCSYYLNYSHDYKMSTNSGKVNNEYDSYIHIATDDAVTLADWETFYNALIQDQNGGCKLIGAVACTV